MAVVSKFTEFFRNYYLVLILLVLSIYSFYPLLSPQNIMNNVHYINDVTFYSFNIKKSLSENSLPLWTPYFYSGRPLFAQPEYHFIDINFILILLTGNIFLAMNYSIIFYFFFAGFGMFILARYVTESKKAAFIASIVYMLNGFTHTFVIPGNIMVLEGYAMVPLIFLFFMKSLKEKEFIFNSVIAGIIAAFLVFTGGMIFLPFIAVLLGIYSIIFLFGPNFRNRVVKLVIITLIISLVGISLSAIKLLPGFDFMEHSNRGEGLPYKEYLGHPLKFKDSIFIFITNVFTKGDHISSALGIIGFALSIIGLFRIKNRIVILSLLSIIFAILTSTESFLTRMLFDVPIFNQTRHVERSIFLYAFSGSILAGIGFLRVNESLEKKKLGKYLFAAIVILICAELAFMQSFPPATKVVHPSEIEALSFISQDKSDFRVVNTALSDLIGATGYNYYAQAGIGEIKGGGGIWFNDYIEYLSVAQNSRAKLWGALSNKYTIEKENSSIEGFDFVGKFNECKECSIWNAWGPYLFRNKHYRPKYFIAENAVLILGEEDATKNLIYGVMLSNWNPNILLISTQNLNGMDHLERFSAVILASNPNNEDAMKLRNYVQSNAKLIPDIFNGKTSLSDSDLEFLSSNSSITELKPKKFENNKLVIDLLGKKGFIGISERFAWFSGWNARLGNNEIILMKADNSITAVYADKEGELVFEYEPSPYRIGKIISIISFSALIIYFGYMAFRKFKGGKNQA